MIIIKHRSMSNKIFKFILFYAVVCLSFFALWEYLSCYPRREQLFLGIICIAGYTCLLFNEPNNE